MAGLRQVEQAVLIGPVPVGVFMEMKKMQHKLIEAELPCLVISTHCCGRPITAEEEHRIYKEETLDYIDGKWVEPGRQKKWRTILLSRSPTRSVTTEKTPALNMWWTISRAPWN